MGSSSPRKEPTKLYARTLFNRRPLSTCHRRQKKDSYYKQEHPQRLFYGGVIGSPDTFAIKDKCPIERVLRASVCVFPLSKSGANTIIIGKKAKIDKEFLYFNLAPFGK